MSENTLATAVVLIALAVLVVAVVAGFLPLIASTFTLDPVR